MLINLRNALMAGKRLPYDAEVEFLESTGTQWIDTGIISNGTGLTVEVTCSKTTSATQEMAIVGRSRSDGFDLYVLNSKFELWNSNSRVAKNPTTISAGEVYDVIGSTTGGAVNLSVNGVNSSHSSVSSFPNGNIVLFRHNSKYYWVGGLMFCKIWQNGTLVRDYIPVRVGSGASAVGYMYDRVSRRLFGNAGTGDFVLGPDVVPVEYIESRGTEWINTGIVPTANDTYTVETRKNNASQDNASFGLAGCIYCFSNATGTFWGHPALGAGGRNGVDPLGDTNWHTIVASPASVSVDGVALSFRTSDAQSPLSTVKLFARGNNSASGGVNKQYNGMISHAFVNRGGSDLRKFLPIRVGTEGAMMDVLTRRIYRNQGTGAFAYGNDLKYPIPAS